MSPCSVPRKPTRARARPGWAETPARSSPRWQELKYLSDHLLPPLPRHRVRSSGDLALWTDAHLSTRIKMPSRHQCPVRTLSARLSRICDSLRSTPWAIQFPTPKGEALVAALISSTATDGARAIPQLCGWELGLTLSAGGENGSSRTSLELGEGAHSSLTITT